MLPSVGGNPRKRTLPIVQNNPPDIGGNYYDRKAVARAVDTRNAPRPLVSQPQRRPAPAPKPPPVVVPNNKGNYSRPAPPPPVNPGPISGGGHKAAPAPQHNGGGNKPRVTVPKEKPIAAPVAPPPVTPGVIPTAQVPDLNTYLAGDADYQGVQGSMAQQLAAFQADQESQRTSGAASFAQRLRDLQAAQGADESNLQEDFASRGLARSGSYADALSQLQQQYLASQGNLQTEQAGWEGSFGTALTDYQTQQQIALQQAQQEAIARRAAQYGLV